MLHKNFARKWRPQKFQNLVGQEIVAKTLKNSILQEQIAQAFLFYGGRGTGKTSCARILAKALNCTNLQEGEPCNLCSNCQQIDKGGAIDIVEIDAASNRGIEHIRKLRENLAYPPVQCKYKIYIIDEVHMLTIESFNALLKSLEEPPSYVKFILATTHEKKIPDTILSRCQRYNFRNISYPIMEAHLQKIASQEGIEIEPQALQKIIQIARGAMRDALMNLEMVYSFCGKKIDEKIISEVLETTSEKDLEKLLLGIFQKNSINSLNVFRSIINKGIPLQTFLTDFLVFIHKICLTKNKETASNSNFEKILRATPTSKLQQYFQILLETEQQIKISNLANLCLEMAILKLCSVQSFANVEDILFQLESKNQKIQLSHTIEKQETQTTSNTAESQTQETQKISNSIEEPQAQERQKTNNIAEPQAQKTQKISNSIAEPQAQERQKTSNIAESHNQNPKENSNITEPQTQETPKNSNNAAESQAQETQTTSNNTAESHNQNPKENSNITEPQTQETPKNSNNAAESQAQETQTTSNTAESYYQNPKENSNITEPQIQETQKTSNNTAEPQAQETQKISNTAESYNQNPKENSNITESQSQETQKASNIAESYYQIPKEKSNVTEPQKEDYDIIREDQAMKEMSKISNPNVSKQEDNTEKTPSFRVGSEKFSDNTKNIIQTFQSVFPDSQIQNG